MANTCRECGVALGTHRVACPKCGADQRTRAERAAGTIRPLRHPPLWRQLVRRVWYRPRLRRLCLAGAVLLVAVGAWRLLRRPPPPSLDAVTVRLAKMHLYPRLAGYGLDTTIVRGRQVQQASFAYDATLPAAFDLRLCVDGDGAVIGWRLHWSQDTFARTDDDLTDALVEVWGPTDEPDSLGARLFWERRTALGAIRQLTGYRHPMIFRVPPEQTKDGVETWYRETRAWWVEVFHIPPDDVDPIHGVGLLIRHKSWVEG